MPSRDAAAPRAPQLDPDENVLVVRPGGRIECLYDDALHLDDIGPLEVTRASNIEYNAREREWEVLDAQTGARLFGDGARGACLEWERIHFAQALANGLHPFPNTPPCSGPGPEPARA